MNERDETRRGWDTAELSGLWEQARKALEAEDPPATFRLELPDDETRQAVGELYGRPMWGQGTRMNVSKLDTQLRRTFGMGLEQILEIVHGRPISRRSGAGAHPPSDTDVVTLALARWNLSEAPWATQWVRWLHQFGRVAAEDLDTVAERAAAVLAHLVLDPRETPRAWTARAELASRFGGDPRLLDAGMTLTRIILRAAALAHGTEPPGNDRDRHRLWERCGVTPDAVSTTALCWALPVVGDDPWSQLIRQRTDLGLPVHLTERDLRSAPDGVLVEAGTAVAVCENPRLLEEAARQDIRHPMVCLAGSPTTTAVELLHRLTDSGAGLHHHGNLDWTGVTVATTMWTEHAARLWRMSAADYREAVTHAASQRVDLPTLVGTPVPTPWDPTLSELMANTGRAVVEENVLPELLDDLRTGLR